MGYQRIPGKFAYRGMDIHHPPDVLPPDKCSLLFNLQPDIQSGAVAMRPPISALATTAAGAPVNSISRLNDSVPEATQPFARFVGASTKLYYGTSGALTQADTGYSGNPLAMVPYRPRQSPESWLYVYDSTKQARFKTDGTKQNIGIASPTAEPTAARIKPLYDILDNATATWSVTATGGTASGPTTIARVPAATTITAILYDSGTSGMCSIYPSSSSCAWMTSCSMAILNGFETVVIEQVFPVSSGTTVAAIAYDSGATGLCTIVPTIPLPGVSRNQLITLNSSYFRVLSVTAGPDGSYSFRVNTGATTIAVTNTIGMPPSFRCWTVYAHVASEVISGNSITSTLGNTPNNLMSALFSATPGTGNLSFAGTRPLQNEDYMHLSIAFDSPNVISEVHILLDVDELTNDFAHNYFYFVLRPGDFQQSSTGLGGTTTLQDALYGIQDSIVSQLTTSESVGAGSPQAPYPIPQTPSSSAPSPAQLQISEFAWLEATFKLSDLTRVGSDASRTLANVAKIGIAVYTNGVPTVHFGGWWAGGGYGPDCNFNSYGNQAPPIQWRYRYWNSKTGALSTVSPETRNGEIVRRQGVNLTAPNSPDSQVDTIIWYRRGGTNPDWGEVARVPQAGSSPTTFLDNVTENAVQAGAVSAEADLVDIATYQPWPVTGAPVTGAATVVGTSVVAASGTPFNTRWLRGTEIIIGNNTYSLYAPPTSSTKLQLAQNVPPPSGSFAYSIPEPTIEGQPLYAAWLDEGANRTLACGDPLNPGLLYFSVADNPDGASDSGYIEVTSPSEPLLNGFYAEGANYVFTSSALYRVDPSQGVNPYASYRLSGVEGMAGPWAFDAQRRIVFFFGPDGVYAYPFGAAAQNLTAEDLYPLFPHAGQLGQQGIPGLPVSIAGQTIYPPNYGQAALLRVGYSESFAYATYQNTNGATEALVYSLGAKGWRKDTYTPAATLFWLEKGITNPLLLVGGSDGNLYQVSPAGGSVDAGGAIEWAVLPPDRDAGDARPRKQWGDLWLDYEAANAPTMQVLWDNLLVMGPAPAIAAAANRSDAILDLFAPPETNDTPLLHFSLTALISGTGPVFLYEMSPSFIALPETTTSRVTDWQNGGTMHNKFVQGIRIHANTSGAAKALQVQFDGYQQGAALTVNFANEQTAAFSFAVPFRAKMFRLVPVDDTAWELWPDSEWIFELEPDPANYWISQPTALGQNGYMHCRELWMPYACGVAGGIVSAVLDGGAPVTLATLGVANTPLKQYFPCPPLKGRYWQIAGSGTGLQIYERDVEFLVKSWGSTEAYSRVRPFGDASGGGGTSGAKI
jgi:hypothetical protein